MVKRVFVNQRIRAKEVRVIGETGEQLGVLPLGKALQIAQERNLDLVEVAPTAVPPVCRLLDYGKYKYEQTKKERKARKGQRTGMLKELRVRPRIKEHDLGAKVKIAKKLLEAGDKVRVSVVFRGREFTHPELGLKLLQKVSDDLKEVAVLDGAPSVETRYMSVTLMPISAKQTKVVKTDSEDSSA